MAVASYSPADVDMAQLMPGKSIFSSAVIGREAHAEVSIFARFSPAGASPAQIHDASHRAQTLRQDTEWLGLAQHAQHFVHSPAALSCVYFFGFLIPKLPVVL